MKREPVISIIVPVYNDEKYISDCLNSIVHQTYPEFEVIIVDDGSTDTTSEICAGFAQSDERFQIIRQENKGVAAARNTGLKYARGKYLMFVDGDDSVLPECFERAYQYITRYHSQIVVFRFRRIEQGISSIDGPSDSFLGLKSNKDVISNLPEIKNYLWNKLYLRSLFDNIEFVPGHIFEEHAVVHKLLKRAETIYIVDDVLYNYQLHSDSLSSNYTKETDNDRFELVQSKVKDLREWGYNEVAEKEELDESYRYLILNGKKGKHSLEAQRNIRTTRSPVRSFSIQANIMVLLIKYNLTLFDFISKLFGKQRNK